MNISVEFVEIHIGWTIVFLQEGIIYIDFDRGPGIQNSFLSGGPRRSIPPPLQLGRPSPRMAVAMGLLSRSGGGGRVIKAPIEANALGHIEAGYTNLGTCNG